MVLLRIRTEGAGEVLCRGRLPRGTYFWQVRPCNA